MNLLTKLSLPSIFFPLLCAFGALNAMEPEETYNHNKLTFNVAGTIELTPSALKGFGTERLIQELKYAGINAEQNDLLVPIKVCIPNGRSNPDNKENYTDWTTEVPPFMIEKIRTTAAAQWQTEQELYGNTSQKCGSILKRKKAVQKDADLKIKNSLFPPALPLRYLETTKDILVTNGFGGINYHLKINPESYAKIQCLRTEDEPIAIFSIPTPKTHEMLTQFKSPRSRQPNQQLDHNIPLESVMVIIGDSIPAVRAAMIKLQDRKIIAKKDSIPETHQFQVSWPIITYLNPCIIPGPNAATDGKEIALKHHGIKRPFDLVHSRQTGPLSKKQRLKL